MPFLTVGGLRVRVHRDGGTIQEPLEVGELMETFDGGTRDGRRGRIRRWTFRTPPMPPTEYQAVYAALTGVSPVLAGGDAMFGEEVPCRARILPGEFVLASGPERPYRTLSFELREA